MTIVWILSLKITLFLCGRAAYSNYFHHFNQFCATGCKHYKALFQKARLLKLHTLGSHGECKEVKGGKRDPASI